MNHQNLDPPRHESPPQHAAEGGRLSVFGASTGDPCSRGSHCRPIGEDRIRRAEAVPAPEDEAAATFSFLLTMTMRENTYWAGPVKCVTERDKLAQFGTFFYYNFNIL